jgi:hypothetical protein
MFLQLQEVQAISLGFVAPSKPGRLSGHICVRIICMFVTKTVAISMRHYRMKQKLLIPTYETPRKQNTSSCYQRR